MKTSKNRFMTRRGFLKRAAWSAAVAPMIAPGSVFGADGKLPPGSRIAVGFIGTGKMADDYHLSTLPGFGDVQAVAVCDVDTARRMDAKGLVENRYIKAGREYRGCDAYQDFRDFLARKDINAVVIAKPDQLAGPSTH